MKFLLSIFCSLCFFLDANILHTYLTFAGETSGAITLNIHSTSKSTLTITLLEKDTPILEKTSKVSDPFLEKISPRYIHFVTFSDLKPACIYKAMISSDDDCKEISFETLPASSKGLRLIVGGDWEKTEGGDTMAKLIALQNPHALILGGDYPRWVRSLEDYKDWDDWLSMIETHLVKENGCSIPMILAIGNHDVFGEYGQPYEAAPFFNAYFKQCEEKRHYFVKTLGDDTALFILDSGHTAEHGGEQELWLEENLRRFQDYKIKIAIYHVPLYPSFRFERQDGLFMAFYYALNNTKHEWKLDKIYSKETAAGRTYWSPLFDCYNLTAAFEHHEHCLKRTKQLRGGEVCQTGTLYLGDGGINPFYYITPIQGYKNHFAKTIGHLNFFWVVDIEENSISYLAIGPHGKKIDQYRQFLTIQD